MLTGLKKQKKSSFLIAMVGFTGVLVGGIWASSVPQRVRADPDVYVSGNGETFQGDAATALGDASAKSGTQVLGIRDSRFELGAISVSDDHDGAPSPVESSYQRKGQPFGEGQLTLIQLPGRQAPADDRRGLAPAPVPVSSSIAAAKIVRVELEGDIVSFTAWMNGETIHFGFYPPLLPNDEMVKIVQDALKSR